MRNLLLAGMALMFASGAAFAQSAGGGSGGQNAGGGDATKSSQAMQAGHPAEASGGIGTSTTTANGVSVGTASNGQTVIGVPAPGTDPNVNRSGSITAKGDNGKN